LEPVRKLAGKPKAPVEASDDVKHQQASVDSLKISLDHLESVLEAKQLKESRQLMKTAQQYYKALDHR
ncbi:hypothetical protein, partial [Nitrosospira sp. NpAV]|uniref:hypothetical protein n=1 Tax=Nitrosospira sp. NpAV TaxID=58133 RepID=UPI00059FA768